MLYDYLTEMIDQIERYRSTNPFIPYEMVVTEETPYLDRTVGEVDFWQETFATVIAIRRNGVLMMSPGPKVYSARMILSITPEMRLPGPGSEIYVSGLIKSTCKSNNFKIKWSCHLLL